MPALPPPILIPSSDVFSSMGKVRAQEGAHRVDRGRSLQPVTVSNRQIAELLALAGEKAEGYVRKAFFRAAHAAFVWPIEAAAIVKENRSLTELPSIGPFLAKTLLKWIESPPAEVPTPPEVRRN